MATDQLHAVAQSPSQSGSGKRRRGLDVPGELARFAELSEPLLAKHDATFHVDAPRATVLRTEMRPELFNSIVSSLVMNALEWKHSQRPLRIASEVRIQGEFVELVVQDNGKGVTSGLEKSLFEPMVSGRDGSGMGLTIARSIVETHGGSVELVVDRRRHGATFRIRLPRKRARATVPAAAKPRQ